jgi:hypothetical protein
MKRRKIGKKSQANHSAAKLRLKFIGAAQPATKKPKVRRRLKAIGGPRKEKNTQMRPVTNQPGVKSKGKGPAKVRTTRPLKKLARPPMLTYSNGETLYVSLSKKAASRNGEYLNAVKAALGGERSYLEAFAGQSIKDLSRKAYPFEVRMNVLYRLDNAETQAFEEVYEFVQ